MRPRAEVRAAVVAAISQGPCTLRDAAERAQVGYAATRHTVSNLVRSGDLQICGQEKRAHAKRWCALYEVVEVVAADALPTPNAVGAEVLALSLRAWGQTPPLVDGGEHR